MLLVTSMLVVIDTHTYQAVFPLPGCDTTLNLALDILSNNPKLDMVATIPAVKGFIFKGLIPLCLASNGNFQIKVGSELLDFSLRKT